MTAEPPSLPVRRPGRIERLAEQAFGWPAPLRAWVARRAARAGLHAHALACAPEDGYVLARAGFFEQAAEHSRPGETGWLGAVAGMGRLDLLAGVEARLDDADRRWIAGLAAAWDAEAALRLLGENLPAEHAACLAALGRMDEAEATLGGVAASPEALMVRAALMGRRGRWDAGCSDIGAAFTAFDMEPPFAAGRAEPPGLADFKPEVAANTVWGEDVSIIVAARDAAATLPMAIGSLLAQSWSDLEVLVVDDGSSDTTRRVVQKLARTDGRVRLLANTGAPGAAGARNAGLTAATGAFVTFHDADDWAHPRRIEQQVEAARRPGVVAAVSAHFRLGADGVPASPRTFPFIRLCPVSVLVRAEAARAAGPLEEEAIGTDSEYLARLDLLFGRPAVTRLKKIHVVAGWEARSLSGATATGLVSAQGRALREAYERDWRVRHAERLREMVG